MIYEDFFDWLKLLAALILGVSVGAFIGIFVGIWAWFSLMV
jgi:F0F1-type ATP synthase assembly protein I